MTKSIVLIGMPGSGKSTVGVLLAKQLRRDFVDTDLVIQTETGRGLQEILDTDGIPGFLAVEERVILGYSPLNRIVATGGSVVYSDKAMTHLSANAVVVYLQCHLESLEKRLRNLDSRGVVRRPGQTVEDLLAEREPLYRRWAHLTIDNSHDDHGRVVGQILSELKAFSIDLGSEA